MLEDLDKLTQSIHKLVDYAKSLKEENKRLLGRLTGRENEIEELKVKLSNKEEEIKLALEDLEAMSAYKEKVEKFEASNAEARKQIHELIKEMDSLIGGSSNDG